MEKRRMKKMCRSSKSKRKGKTECHGKSETVSDLKGILAESIPEEDTDQSQLVAFINRQYRGYKDCAKKTAKCQHRMGTILLRLHDIIPHGEWEQFVRETFEFEPRTARNWMDLAKYASPEDAEKNSPTDLYTQIRAMRRDEAAGTEETGDTTGKDATARKPKSKDDGMKSWKPLGNHIRRGFAASQKVREAATLLTPDSNHDDHKQFNTFEGLATDIEGIIANWRWVRQRVLEMARQVQQNGVNETTARMNRNEDDSSSLEDDVRAVNAESDTDGPDDPDGRKEAA